MCIDITKMINRHNWNDIAKIKKFFLHTNNPSIRTLPVIFFDRYDDNYVGKEKYGIQGYTSNESITFSNGCFYNSKKHNILNYHCLGNSNDPGVVTYMRLRSDICHNTYLSTGPLSGCIVCMLVFQKYVLFIHEGGSDSENKDDPKKQLSSRVYDIWRAICARLKISYYFTADSVKENTGDFAIDWLIQRIEDIKDFLFGSIMYYSETNPGKRNLSYSKKITYMNYKSTNANFSHMLCILQNNYIGSCSMFWDSNSSNPPEGLIIEANNLNRDIYSL